MSIAPVEVNLELKNEKVKFEGVSKSNPEKSITFDYLPPLGDSEGFLGLDVLVMSFAGCVSTAIVALLRKMGKTILEYKMNVTGIKRESPLALEKVCFEIIVKSPDIIEEDIKKVIKIAEGISPVWLAVKNNVEVTYNYQLF